MAEANNPLSLFAFALLAVPLLQLLPGYENCNATPDRGAHLSDFVTGRPRIALASSFVLEPGAFFDMMPALRNVKEHLAVVIGQESMVEPMRAALDVIRETGDLLSATVTRAPTLTEYAAHHSKFLILVYDWGVQVVVTTGNFIEVEYNAKTQGIWSQKFPWKDSQSPPTSDFEEQLVDYVPRLGIPADPEAALLDALRRGDFSSARADLVMSIPGNHRGEDYHRYGMGRLRSLLSRATGFADSLVGSQLVAQCSSLGTLTVRWAHDWIEAVGGGVTRSGAPLGYPRAGRGNGALPLSIVWPTVQQVAASVEGAALGGFGLFGSRAKLSRPAVRRRLVLWGGGPVPRTPAMPHIKTFCRVDHETGKIAWLYLGSGNFGPAAWGDSPMAGNGLASSTVSNWEVGVLLLPEREAAYRAHRHCGLNGDVAEGAARPPPATGARRVEFYAVGRAPTQAAADTDVVQLPLPYSLPPQRYRPGQDQPWVS